MNYDRILSSATLSGVVITASAFLAPAPLRHALLGMAIGGILAAIGIIVAHQHRKV